MQEYLNLNLRVLLSLPLLNQTKINDQIQQGIAETTLFRREEISLTRWATMILQYPGGEVLVDYIQITILLRHMNNKCQNRHRHINNLLSKTMPSKHQDLITTMNIIIDLFRIMVPDRIHLVVFNLTIAFILVPHLT